MTDPLPSLKSLKESYAELDKVKKNHIKLVFTVLIISLGLFFYLFSEDRALAQKNDKKFEITAETVDPLHKIGKGIGNEKHSTGDFCGEQDIAENKNIKNALIPELLKDSPMEMMISFLNEQENETVAYVIAIAKKESNLGKYAPKKDGRDCYNYWGYRGKENTTESGYSCFDSPAHAVKVVGNRIERLIEQDINTPAKMVIWKCGSDCEAAGGQTAANKWISDVALYYNKLNS